MTKYLTLRGFIISPILRCAPHKSYLRLMSMLSHMRINFVFGSLCLFAFSLAQAEPMQTFRDSSDGVAFSYPASWVVKTQRTGYYRIMVGDKNALGGSCMLSTKTNPSLAKYSDLEAIRSTSAKDIENGARHSGGLSIFSFEQTKIGNRPAILYEANSSYQSLGFNTPLRILAGMVKIGDKLYELVCVAHPDVAQAHRGTFLHVIGSLTVRYDP